jgi:hypothetical protein
VEKSKAEKMKAAMSAGLDKAKVRITAPTRSANTQRQHAAPTRSANQQAAPAHSPACARTP